MGRGGSGLASEFETRVLYRPLHGGGVVLAVDMNLVIVHGDVDAHRRKSGAQSALDGFCTAPAAHAFHDISGFHCSLHVINKLFHPTYNDRLDTTQLRSRMPAPCGGPDGLAPHADHLETE